VAHLGELTRRMPNPFLVELNVSEKYARREDAFHLALGARTQATTNRDKPPILALSAFILWYLGERDQAISAAEGLTSGGGSFADWAAKMRAATKIRSGGRPVE
jgi:hypothetical protein